jgi:hypothetical protein
MKDIQKRRMPGGYCERTIVDGQSVAVSQQMSVDAEALPVWPVTRIALKKADVVVLGRKRASAPRRRRRSDIAARVPTYHPPSSSPGHRKVYGCH